MCRNRRVGLRKYKFLLDLLQMSAIIIIMFLLKALLSFEAAREFWFTAWQSHLSLEQPLIDVPQKRYTYKRKTPVVCLNLFLMKLQERNPDEVVFTWILQNIWGYLFLERILVIGSRSPKLNKQWVTQLRIYTVQKTWSRILDEGEYSFLQWSDFSGQKVTDKFGRASIFHKNNFNYQIGGCRLNRSRISGLKNLEINGTVAGSSFYEITWETRNFPRIL